jgi:TetR/AcrR family transcriptional repressor of uid operon
MGRKLDPERYEARRRQILEAAMVCFASNGFHQTSTAQICAEAGMSSGNIFHYFASKEAIIEAIVAEERQEAAAYFAELDGVEDLFGAILGFLDISLRFAADETYVRLVLEIAAEAIRNPTIGAMAAAVDADTRAGLAELVRRAIARGQVDAGLDPDRTATGIAALIDGIFSRLAIDPQFKPLEEAPTLRLMVERFLRPEGRA